MGITDVSYDESENHSVSFLMEGYRENALEKIKFYFPNIPIEMMAKNLLILWRESDDDKLTKELLNFVHLEIWDLKAIAQDFNYFKQLVSESFYEY